MPTYEYKCSSCDHEWEEEQRIVEDPLDTCPACHEKTARRQISGGNFILKGGGWYADLYSKPSKRGGTSGGSSTPSSKPSGSSTSNEASGTTSSPSSSPGTDSGPKTGKTSSVAPSS